MMSDLRSVSDMGPRGHGGIAAEFELRSLVLTYPKKEKSVLIKREAVC